MGVIETILQRGVNNNCQFGGVNEQIVFDVTTMYAPKNSPQKHGERLKVVGGYYYGALDKSLRLITIDSNDEINEVFMYNDVLNNYRQSQDVMLGD